MSQLVTPSNALQFFSIVGKLKELKRTGWVNHGIHSPESVADHIYRMSMLTFMITDASVDKTKLMKICMVHDLAEAIVGDITPYDGVTKEEKRILEENALNKIADDIGNEAISNEIKSLWLEYEDTTTSESILAHQLDKLEMIIQANEYEIKEPDKNLESFFESTENSFHHPEIKAWADQLCLDRNKRIKNKEVK